MTGPAAPAATAPGVRYIRAGLAALFLAALAFTALPVVQFEEPYSAVVLDQDEQLLDAQVAEDEQWRFPPREALPPRFAAALLVVEDKRFRSHPGVDPLAVARAIRLNLEAGRVVSGASTLTMQTVRIARHNPARTLPEKFWEMLLALRLEAALSKDEILAAYAAHAPFGGNTVGLEAAAWRYFGRSPRDLSWAEAASLAVLPNDPSMVHPGRNRERLRQKRDRLLEVLAERAVLSPTDLQTARAEPLPPAPVPMPHLAPHLAAQLRRGPNSGRRAVTTLERPIQEQVDEVLRRHHERLAAGQIHNLAALVARVDSGAVLAYSGNVPEFSRAEHGNYVDIVQAPRSTGSLLKPLLYEAMLESGELLPNELVPDTPMRLGGFAPENFDKSYLGAVPASEALARSRNVSAAWMLRSYGVQRFGARLRSLGMTSLHRASDDYGLSLVLGGAEGTLWNLAALYRNLARSVLKPEDDEVPALHWRLGDTQPMRATLPDPAAAWLTLEALQEVHRPGVHGSWRSFGSARQVAWKTGTSFGFRDGWAIGVDPNVVVAVWVGNHDGEGRPGLTGFQAAAPLLFDLFDLFEDSGWFEEPTGLAEIEVCSHSGQRAGPDCPESRTEVVPLAALKSTGCSFCRRIHCERDCAQRVHAGCTTLDEMHSEPWFVLPPGQEWFYTKRHSDYRPLPPWREDCRPAEEQTAAISVLYPRDGAEIYVPVELSGERGRVVFEAAHRERNGQIHWHLDEDFVGSTEDIHQVALAPSPGAHRLTLVDTKGHRLVHRFVVLDAER